MKNVISPALISTIEKVMDIPLVKQLDFALGGGVALAIKYNYRVSVDIDLFTSKRLSPKEVIQLVDSINNCFNKGAHLKILNAENNDLTMVQGYIMHNQHKIDIDIMQNIPFCHNYDNINNIKIISDLDIGALKLLAAADRGARKDFYDLYFLSKKYGFDTLYKELQHRNSRFKSNKNIFNTAIHKPKNDLSLSLTALGDFNKAMQLSSASNRIILTEHSYFSNINWAHIKKEMVKMAIQTAKQYNLSFVETDMKRRHTIRLIM